MWTSAAHKDNRKVDKTSLEYEVKTHIAEASKYKAEANLKKKITNHGTDASKCIWRNCWVSGKSSHTTTMCKYKKGQHSNNQANVMENDDLVVTIFEVSIALDTKS